MPIYRLPVLTSSLPLQKLNSNSSNQDGRHHHLQHPQQHHVEQHPSHTKHHMQQQQQQQQQHQHQHQHLDPNENIIKRSNSIPIQTTPANHSTSSPAERVSIIPSDESIVEREIRLQLEREAEIALLHGGDMRSGRSARRQTDASNHSQGDYVPVVESTHSPEMHREPREAPRETPRETPRGTPRETPMGTHRGSAGVDMEDGGRKAIINQYSKVGESLIVRELMEQKRREEELRHHWRNTGMLKSDDVDDGRGGGSSSSSSEDDYRSRPGSGESLALQAIPTSNIRAIIRVQPLEDPDDDPKRKFITPRLETVIEREIRVQRQREGSLRRARGYPLQSREDRLKQVEVPVHPPPSAFHKPINPGEQRGPLPPGVERRSVDGDASDEQSVQRFATNRLKQEMLRERQRELDLRRQGKIYTISEERVGLEREGDFPSSKRSLHGEDSMNSGGYVSRGDSEVNLREAESFLHPNDFYGDNAGTVGEFVVVENQRTGGGGGGLPSWRTASELRIEEEVKEARRREKELREQRRLAIETLTNQTEQLQLHERQHQRNNIMSSQQHNRNFYRRT